MLIAMTRPVSPSINACELTFHSQQPIDVAKATEPRGALCEPAVAKVDALGMNETTQCRCVHGNGTAHVTAECFRECRSLRGERDVVGRDNFEGHVQRKCKRESSRLTRSTEP